MGHIHSARQILTTGIVISLLLIGIGLNSTPVAHASETKRLPFTAQSTTDPASWPVITADNAKYLTLAGVFGHGNNTQALWAGDGHTIIVGGDRGVWLYDARIPDAPPFALDEPDLPVRSMALSHNGKMLAVAAGYSKDWVGVGDSIRIWDLPIQNPQPSRVIATDVGPIWFNMDDAQIAEEVLDTHSPATHVFWSSETGQKIAYVKANNLFANDDQVQLHLGVRAQLAAVVDENGNVQVWSTLTDAQAKQFAESQHLLDIHADEWFNIQPDQGLLAVRGLGHWLWIFNLKNLTLIDAIDLSKQEIPDNTISPDGTIRVEIENNVIRLRDIQTDSVTTKFPGTAVEDFAFSPDDRAVALLDGTNVVQIVDVATARPKFNLIGHTAPVLHASFSADGRWIATISADQTVRLWDAVTGQQSRIWTPDEALFALAFSPDGQILAVSCAGNIIRLWDVNTGRLFTKLTGPGEENTDLQFHSNGLLSIYSNSYLKPGLTGLTQWDWRNSLQHGTALDPTTNILAVSPDGGFTIGVTTGCEGSGIALIDNVNGKILFTINNCNFYELGYAYNTTGNLVVAHAYVPGNDGIASSGWVVVKALPDFAVVGGVANIDGNHTFSTAKFSQSGRVVAAIDDEGVLIIWRVAFPPSIQF